MDNKSYLKISSLLLIAISLFWYRLVLSERRQYMRHGYAFWEYETTSNWIIYFVYFPAVLATFAVFIWVVRNYYERPESEINKAWKNPVQLIVFLVILTFFTVKWGSEANDVVLYFCALPAELLLWFGVRNLFILKRVNEFPYEKYFADENNKLSIGYFTKKHPDLIHLLKKSAVQS